MKKTLLFTLICFLLLGLISNSMAINLKEPKYTVVNLTMNDGQIKKGKVKKPFDLGRKIVLILENGVIENIIAADVHEIILYTDYGASMTYENVVHFKNSRSNSIEEKPSFMSIIVKGPLTLYLKAQESVSHSMGIGDSYSYYTNYYAIRDGEFAASPLSSSVSGQLNPNSVFRHAAAVYFADYKELAAKIEDKTYTYKDIIAVATEYNNWKKLR